MMSPSESFESCFLNCYGFVGFVDVSPIGFQSLKFGEFISQVQVLKVGVPSVSFKPFAPQEEYLGFEFSPDRGLPCQGCSLWQDSVSASLAHFDTGLLWCRSFA